jgi:hypothetical protein
VLLQAEPFATFLSQLLVFDPEQRVSAADALRSDWLLTTGPSK